MRKTPAHFLAFYLLPLLAFAALGLELQYRGIMHVLVPGSEGENHQRLARFYGPNAPNKALTAIETDSTIIMLGSSRMHISYYPPLISSRAYNLGIDNCGLAGSNRLLELEYASDRKGPIIFNYDYMSWPRVGDVLSYLPIYDQAIIQKMLRDPEVNIDRSWYRYRLTRFYGLFETYLSYYLLSNKAKKNTVVEQGYMNPVHEHWDRGPFDASIAAREAFNNMHRNGTYDVVSVFRQNELYNLVSAHPERKIYLITAPLHCSICETPTDPNALTFPYKLAGLKHVKFLEPNTSQYPDSFFHNTTHVNFHGAKAFSKWLGDTLRKGNFER
ncbi:MAG: hypothetical protein V4543_09235 [Bacteroidota bacterium]